MVAFVRRIDMVFGFYPDKEGVGTGTDILILDKATI